MPTFLSSGVTYGDLNDRGCTRPERGDREWRVRASTHWWQSPKNVRHSGDKNHPLSTKSTKLNMFNLGDRVDFRLRRQCLPALTEPADEQRQLGTVLLQQLRRYRVTDTPLVRQRRSQRRDFSDANRFKGKLKRPQSLCQLRGKCITITIPHNTACLEKR